MPCLVCANDKLDKVLNIGRNVSLYLDKTLNLNPDIGKGPVITYVRLSQVDQVKASAHSFKQFTSRLLKSTFSLSMHIYNSDERHA